MDPRRRQLLLLEWGKCSNSFLSRCERTGPYYMQTERPLADKCMSVLMQHVYERPSVPGVSDGHPLPTVDPLPRSYRVT